MHPLLDFLPIVAFGAAYWIHHDFRFAIGVLMAAMVVQVVLTWLVRRTVSRMTLASAALVVVLGGISLLLKNELVFKWKPTILNWAFALVFLGSHFIGSRPVIQRLMQSVAPDELSLADRDWRILSFMWVAFFVASGAANLYVAYNFTEEVWVNFKVFGLIGMTVVFMLLQVAWLMRRNRATAGHGAGD